MKRIWLSLCIQLICIASFCQQKKKEDAFYLWDKDWTSTTDPANAAYLARLSMVNDTLWNWEVYNNMGPMISSQQFRDPQLHQATGKHVFFHPSGYMDSTGFVVNNHPDGDWTYFDPEGKWKATKTFNMGRLVSMDSVPHEENQEVQGDETESSFPGGEKKWKNYLSKNLYYPDRALKGNVKGSVTVQFIVDTTGRIQNVEIYKSLEYSLDQATIKMIANAPLWIPGQKSGSKVKTYKLQKIVYNF